MKRLFFKDGFVFMPKLVDQELLSRFDSIMRPKVNRVLDAVEEKEEVLTEILEFPQILSFPVKAFQNHRTRWMKNVSVVESQAIVRQIAQHHSRKDKEQILLTKHILAMFQLTVTLVWKRIRRQQAINQKMKLLSPHSSKNP